MTTKREVQVSCTVYYSVESNSDTDAINQVKQLVAEELNGNASEWSKYKVVSRG